METMITARRDLLITPWLAALPAATASMTAHAAVDPTMTIVKPPEEIKWSTGGAPPMSVEQAPLWGSVNEPGLYYTLVKWHPGYMSGGLGHLVGGQRREFRSGKHRAGAGGQLRATCRPHPAL